MGACQTGGSVIDWVMRAEGVSFRHAVELLRAGEAPVVTGARRSTARRLSSPVEADADDQAALAQVVAYYHATLTESPEALAYLARRRIDDPAALERFSPRLRQPDPRAAPARQADARPGPSCGAASSASASTGRRATSTWPARSSSR